MTSAGLLSFVHCIAHFQINAWLLSLIKTFFHHRDNQFGVTIQVVFPLENGSLLLQTVSC